KKILRKVKSGGNAIISACAAGYSKDGSEVGLNFANALGNLSGNRLNLCLSTGFCKLYNDDPTASGAGGILISGSMNGPNQSDMPSGWLKQSHSKNHKMLKDIIIHLS